MFKFITSGAAILALVTTLATPPGVPEDNSSKAQKAVFTMDRIEELKVPNAAISKLQAVPRAQNSRKPLKDPSPASSSDDIALLSNGAGSYAVADLSLLNHKGGEEAAIWAASPEAVDLSWQNPGDISEAVVFKNGIQIASVAGESFRDNAVSPGEEVSYRIETLGPETIEGKTWGLEVSVPTGDASSETSMLNATSTLVATMAARSFSSVRYQTFIPQRRINSPLGVCGSYSGSAYEFDGNNRSWSPTGSYKTRVNANIDWSAGGALTSSKGVSSTKVYRKSTGQLLATRTASSAGISVKRLALSNSKAVDLRFDVRAGNPFCTAVPNFIEGVFTMTVTRAGSWSISSGWHKQMPNHEIGIHGGSGIYRLVYTRAYAHEACLVKFACPTVQLSGYRGSY